MASKTFPRLFALLISCAFSLGSIQAHANIFDKAKKGVKKGASAVSSTAKKGASAVKKTTKTVVKGTTSTAKKVGGAVAGGAAVAAGAVAGAATTVGKGAAKAAGDTFHAVDKTAHKVGDTVVDSSEKIGKEVSKSGDTVTREVVKNGKVVGRVVIKGGKIVATQTVEAGKVVATKTVEGGKFIVKGGEIVGREIVVGGKVVGSEVIKGGKVVGHTVVEAGKYVVKAGEFVLNGLTAEVCKATMAALKGATKIKLPAVPGMPGLPNFEKVMSDLVAKTNAKKGLFKNAGKKNEVLNLAANGINASKEVIGEMKRLEAQMKSTAGKVKDLFSESNFCTASPSSIDKKLADLGLRPSFARKSAFLDNGFFIREAQAATDHFFMAYNLSASAAYGVGAGLTLSIITDYSGHTGFYVSLGPQLVTNVAGGASLGAGFFPKVSADSFEGWGWSVGASGGPPSKIVGAAVDVSFDESFTKFQGFGVSGTVGAGISPVDIGVGGSWTWKVR